MSRLAAREDASGPVDLKAGRLVFDRSFRLKKRTGAQGARYGRQ